MQENENIYSNEIPIEEAYLSLGKASINEINQTSQDVQIDDVITCSYANSKILSRSKSKTVTTVLASTVGTLVLTGFVVISTIISIALSNVVITSNSYNCDVVVKNRDNEIILCNLYLDDDLVATREFDSDEFHLEFINLDSCKNYYLEIVTQDDGDVIETEEFETLEEDI